MTAYWTDELLEAQLVTQGCVVCFGQISDQQKRKLDKRAKTGELVKYRGHWNDPLGLRGFGLGPLKTIYRRRFDGDAEQYLPQAA